MNVLITLDSGTFRNANVFTRREPIIWKTGKIVVRSRCCSLCLNASIRSSKSNTCIQFPCTCMQGTGRYCYIYKDGVVVNHSQGFIEFMSKFHTVKVSGTPVLIYSNTCSYS